MDTTRDLEKKKKESERTLEKPFQGKPGEHSSDKYYYLNGQRIEIADDLLDLPEVDYDDPDVQKWMAETEAEGIRRYGKMTSEEADYMYARRLVLEKEFPEKSVIELNQVALAEFRTGNKSDQIAEV